MLGGESGNQAFQDGDVIGFWGDSITHAEYSEINYTHVLYDYYVTHMPEKEIEIRNLGVGGARVPHGWELYGRDPSGNDVNKVVIEYGINDLKKYYYEDEELYGKSAAEREQNIIDYGDNLTTFLNMLTEGGLEKENISLTTLPVPCTGKEGAGNHVDEGFEGMSEIARNLAREQGLTLFELEEPLTELAETLPDNAEQGILREDGLHLNTSGQIYLAYLFLEQQGALKDVSNVRIQKEGIDSGDAEVSNLHFKKKYLYYDYKPKRLPMGISHEYTEADKSLHILDKLNREIIQVDGLQADTVYDIYISGEWIGSFDGAAFSEGVNIANIKANPAQQFGRTIEQMNRGRRVSELTYRKVVQNCTDCGSGQTTDEELLAAYETWREEDAAYRQNMYSIARDRLQVTERVAIIEQGAKAPRAALEVPGTGHKKEYFAMACIPCAVILLGLVLYRRKKRGQKG